MSEPLRVVVAEDNYLVREGIRRLLEETERASVVAAVGNTRELIDATVKLRPDVVVSDIRMPPHHGMDGIRAAHAIRERHPGTGVVILSQYVEEAYAFALFEHGTAGYAYLLKDRIGEVDELIGAVRAVADGGSVVDPIVIESLVSSRTRLARSPLRRLTDREMDVLRLMARGYANRAIASALNLSESTVEKHVGAIFGKLDLAPEPATDRRVHAVLLYLHGRADAHHAD